MRLTENNESGSIAVLVSFEMSIQIITTAALGIPELVRVVAVCGGRRVLVSNGKHTNGEHSKVIDKNVVTFFVSLYDEHNGCRYKVIFVKQEW